MPPRISHGPLNVSSTRSKLPLRCTKCSFSTSLAPRSQIPPESPRFINIPRPVQPDTIYRPWIKGVLPIPRQIISMKQRATKKATPKYLAAVTPDPVERNHSHLKGEKLEYVTWKARQAELRRRNLREGLVELQHRKEQITQILTDRQKRHQKRNMTRRYAPEKEDVRLTSPSVLQSSLPKRQQLQPTLQDQSQFEQAARTARVQANLAKKKSLTKEDKRDLLHTLYVNAGDFSTTEAQLEEKIKQAFDDMDQFKTDVKDGMNIWNLGVPETTRELVTRFGRRAESNKAVDAADANEQVTKERVKRIAELLTGGKIEDPPKSK